MKRNIRALLLIVLIAIIVVVVLGVFLPGSEDENGAPATVASVENQAVPVAESAPAKQSEPVDQSAPAKQTESVAETAPVAESAPAEKSAAAENATAAKTESSPRVQEESSVARATPEDSTLDSPVDSTLDSPVDSNVDSAAASSPAPVPLPDVIRPSFDVVRISPSGRAVVAGRAEPGAKVTVLDDGISIGSVFADERGEWVLLPEESLAGGDRELSLVQDTVYGERIASDQVVVLSDPKPRDKPTLTATESTETERVVAQVEAAGQSEKASEQAENAGAVEAVEASEAVAANEASETVEETVQETVIAVLVARDGDGPSRILQGPDLAGEGIGEESEVTIRSVDYDSEGDVTLAGRTEPEATVNVYVDDEYIGSAQASTEGEWELSPEVEVAHGQHRLRIDKVDDAGIVLARIETPISRARPEELLLGDALVVVQPGNSLWRIARRAYGGGVYYTEIYGANRAQILDPNMIFPGQILALPVLN